MPSVIYGLVNLYREVCDLICLINKLNGSWTPSNTFLIHWTFCGLDQLPIHFPKTLKLFSHTHSHTIILIINRIFHTRFLNEDLASEPCSADWRPSRRAIFHSKLLERNCSIFIDLLKLFRFIKTSFFLLKIQMKKYIIVVKLTISSNFDALGCVDSSQAGQT